VGGLCFNGSCDMIDHYGSAGITEFKNWTIFGDPSIRIRTTVPQALTVTHAGAVDPLGDQFPVQTAPEALVALSHDGTFIASAFADAGGSAVVAYDGADLSGLSTVTLTVTGFNAVPHVEQMPLEGVVSVADGPGALDLALGSRPNPFRSSALISFELDLDDDVMLEVFDASGRRLRTLREGLIEAGRHEVGWDGTDGRGVRVAPGTYFYRLTVGDEVQTRSLVLLR
jgi:hypothetical protein